MCSCSTNKEPIIRKHKHCCHGESRLDTSELHVIEVCIFHEMSLVYAHSTSDISEVFLMFMCEYRKVIFFLYFRGGFKYVF